MISPADILALRTCARTMRRLMSEGVLAGDWDEHVRRIEALEKAVHAKYALELQEKGCGGCPP